MKKIIGNTAMRRRNRSRFLGARRGVAATELAACAPVIVLIVLATIEACTMIFLQQSLSVAAYEGARVAIIPNAAAVNVELQCRQILDDRGVKGATITVTPASIATAPEGTWLQIRASAPFDQNSLAGGWLFNDHTLAATVEMIKER